MQKSIHTYSAKNQVSQDLSAYTEYTRMVDLELQFQF